MKYICCTCFYSIIHDMLLQLCHVYSNLQSILLPHETKPCLTEKIVEKLYSSDRVKNLEDFLNEGKEYLNLANSLDECNQRNPTIFAIMLKALDIYSRLKVQFQSVNYDQTITGISIFEHCDRINSDEEYYDYLYDSDTDYSINSDMSDNDDPFVWFSDYDGHINQVDFIGQSFHYKIMLMKIELLITRIQNVYIAFIRNRLLFALILMNYFKRLDLFLSNNAEILNLHKLTRSQLQDIRYKYNLLKQLTERIAETLTVF
ncbi:uncharacterized protein [Linepithema humile]|uniref:uncharacterized protein isoform X2 n=1 Tax=Linepithema humile TaxID=83485 RepID=UPI00351F6005